MSSNKHKPIHSKISLIKKFTLWRPISHSGDKKTTIAPVKTNLKTSPKTTKTTSASQLSRTRFPLRQSLIALVEVVRRKRRRTLISPTVITIQLGLLISKESMPIIVALCAKMDSRGGNRLRCVLVTGSQLNFLTANVR